MWNYIFLPNLLMCLGLVLLLWAISWLSACSSVPIHTFRNLDMREVSEIATYLSELNPDREVYVTRTQYVGPYAGYACFDCKPCYIELAKEVPKEFLKTVIWHEYGHCAGLEHTERGIMAHAVHEFKYYDTKSVSEFLDGL